MKVRTAMRRFHGAWRGTSSKPADWLVRAGGSALAVGAMEVALTLGLGDATRVSETSYRLAALVGGALIATTRGARWLAIAAVSLCALLFVVMFTPLVESPVRSLLRADTGAQPADAIVVFSGSMTDAGHIGDIALGRLVSAIMEAQRLGIPDLIVSEQQRRANGQQVSTLPDQTALVAQLGGGVRLSSVSGVSNTHNESLAFAALARTRGWTHVRAVTSPMHARRACASLEATGLRVTCSPSTPRDLDFSHLSTPNARLIAARAALHETVGLIYYRWRGWLA